MKIFSEISISKLFQPNYIFEATPAADGLYIYLVIIFGLMILGAVSVSIFKNKFDKIYRKLQKRIFNLLLTIGIVGLFLIFVRFEQIPYLGSRLMILLLLFAFLLWGGWVVYYRIFIIPEEKKEAEKKKKFNKYLPQASKRKIRGSIR